MAFDVKRIKSRNDMRMFNELTKLRTATPFIGLVALLVVFFAAGACAQSEPSSPSSSPAPAPRRVPVDSDTASTMIVQKPPLRYPGAALKAGIQGKVVLKVVTNYSGDVQEVTVVSGDPALAQAAAEAVKQWKYKPYVVEGSPAEMETQVSVNFQIKAPAPPTAPSLGRFFENTYRNNDFGISYPLSRDWVRETDWMRGKLSSENNSAGTYVLLAAAHIPQDTDALRANSSIIVYAVSHPRASPQECRQYLESMSKELHSQKEGKQTGDLVQVTLAGHDFYRGDFEYRHGVDHRTFLCTPVRDYLLQWTIVGWSKQAIETAVSTLNSMTFAPPTAQPESLPLGEDSNTPKRVRVTSGVTTGLLIKKVVPVYPPEARNAHIQGAVVLKALISKTGDIDDLEVLSGPSELVVSAVIAVRKWKYRPYLFKGEPVAVQTEIVVNYTLQF
jgi:TonB family protein